MRDFKYGGLFITILLLSLFGRGQAQNKSTRNKPVPTKLISLDDYPCGTSGGNSNFSLMPELWTQSRMDDYLSNHPTLKNMTIDQYAASVGMPNFYCGIGLECMAGQICYPAIGKDYLILYSIQQWNNFMNTMYGAVQSVIMQLMDTSAGIVTDFIPASVKPEGSLFGYAIATVVIASLAMFTGPIAPLIVSTQAAGAAVAASSLVSTVNSAAETYKAARAAALAQDAHAVEQAMQMKDAVALTKLADTAKAAENLKQVPKVATPAGLAEDIGETVGQTAATTAKARLRLKRDLEISRHNLQRRSILRKRSAGPPNVLAYTRWSFLTVHLARLRTQLLNFVSLSSQMAVAAPIYSDKGIGPSILEGAFLTPNPTWGSMVEETKKLGKIVLLSEFFVSLGFVATIGQEPCKFKGAKGAWDGPEFLSECDDKGVMYSIVGVNKDKFEWKIRNAKFVTEKYNYTVSDLVKRASECQNKHGVYGNNTAPAPTKENSPCSFQLPTCDLTKEDFKRNFEATGRNHVKACRAFYNLPI